MRRNFLLVIGLAAIPILFGCINSGRQEARMLAEDAYINDDTGKYNVAISLISKEIKDNPSDKELYLTRGYYYSKLGKKEEASSDYSKAINIDPAYAYAYNNRCYNYFELKDYKKALPDCNMAISLDPKYWQAYDSRGHLKLAMGDAEGACSDYINAVKYDDDPDDDPFTYGEKNGKEWLSSEAGMLCRLP